MTGRGKMRADGSGGGRPPGSSGGISNGGQWRRRAMSNVMIVIAVALVCLLTTGMGVFAWLDANQAIETTIIVGQQKTSQERQATNDTTIIIRQDPDRSNAMTTTQQQLQTTKTTTTTEMSTSNGTSSSPPAAPKIKLGTAELNPDASDTVPLYMQHMTVILVTLHLSVFITGLVGNSLVCLSVYRNKSLQTVTNYYIVNLAVADFLVILICLPPTVYWDLTLTWNFGLVLCKMVLYLQSISVSVSVLTLTCISIDRWYAICRPLKFSSSKSRAKSTIGMIWLASMIIASPDVIFLTTKPLYEEDDYVYMDCTYSWPESSTKIYQLCIVTLLFVFPFVLMSISYSQIVNVLWRNETMAETMQNSMQIEDEEKLMKLRCSTAAAAAAAAAAAISANNNNARNESFISTTSQAVRLAIDPHRNHHHHHHHNLHHSGSHHQLTSTKRSASQTNNINYHSYEHEKSCHSDNLSTVIRCDNDFSRGTYNNNTDNKNHEQPQKQQQQLNKLADGGTTASCGGKLSMSSQQRQQQSAGTLHRLVRIARCPIQSSGCSQASNNNNNNNAQAKPTKQSSTTSSVHTTTTTGSLSSSSSLSGNFTQQARSPGALSFAVLKLNLCRSGSRRKSTRKRTPPPKATTTGPHKCLHTSGNSNDINIEDSNAGASGDTRAGATLQLRRNCRPTMAASRVRDDEFDEDMEMDLNGGGKGGEDNLVGYNGAGLTGTRAEVGPIEMDEQQHQQQKCATTNTNTNTTSKANKDPPNGAVGLLACVNYNSGQAPNQLAGPPGSAGVLLPEGEATTTHMQFSGLGASHGNGQGNFNRNHARQDHQQQERAVVSYGDCNVGGGGANHIEGHSNGTGRPQIIIQTDNAPSLAAVGSAEQLGAGSGDKMTPTRRRRVNNENHDKHDNDNAEIVKTNYHESRRRRHHHHHHHRHRRHHRHHQHKHLEPCTERCSAAAADGLRGNDDGADHMINPAPDTHAHSGATTRTSCERAREDLDGGGHEGEAGRARRPHSQRQSSLHSGSCVGGAPGRVPDGDIMGKITTATTTATAACCLYGLKTHTNQQQQQANKCKSKRNRPREEGPDFNDGRPANHGDGADEEDDKTVAVAEEFSGCLGRATTDDSMTAGPHSGPARPRKAAASRAQTQVTNNKRNHLLAPTRARPMQIGSNDDNNDNEKDSREGDEPNSLEVVATTTANTDEKRNPTRAPQACCSQHRPRAPRSSSCSSDKQDLRGRHYRHNRDRQRHGRARPAHGGVGRAASMATTSPTDLDCNCLNPPVECPSAAALLGLPKQLAPLTLVVEGGSGAGPRSCSAEPELESEAPARSPRSSSTSGQRKNGAVVSATVATIKATPRGSRLDAKVELPVVRGDEPASGSSIGVGSCACDLSAADERLQQDQQQQQNVMMAQRRANSYRQLSADVDRKRRRRRSEESEQSAARRRTTSTGVVTRLARSGAGGGCNENDNGGEDDMGARRRRSDCLGAAADSVKPLGNHNPETRTEIVLQSGREPRSPTSAKDAATDVDHLCSHARLVSELANAIGQDTKEPNGRSAAPYTTSQAKRAACPLGHHSKGTLQQRETSRDDVASDEMEKLVQLEGVHVYVAAAAAAAAAVHSTTKTVVANNNKSSSKRPNWSRDKLNKTLVERPLSAVTIQSSLSSSTTMMMMPFSDAKMSVYSKRTSYDCIGLGVGVSIGMLVDSGSGSSGSGNSGAMGSSNVETATGGLVARDRKEKATLGHGGEARRAEGGRLSLSLSSQSSSPSPSQSSSTSPSSQSSSRRSISLLVHEPSVKSDRQWEQQASDGQLSQLKLNEQQQQHSGVQLAQSAGSGDLAQGPPPNLRPLPIIRIRPTTTTATTTTKTTTTATLSATTLSDSTATTTINGTNVTATNALTGVHFSPIGWSSSSAASPSSKAAKSGHSICQLNQRLSNHGAGFQAKLARIRKFVRSSFPLTSTTGPAGRQQQTKNRHCLNELLVVDHTPAELLATSPVAGSNSGHFGGDHVTTTMPSGTNKSGRRRMGCCACLYELRPARNYKPTASLLAGHDVTGPLTLATPTQLQKQLGGGGGSRLQPNQQNKQHYHYDIEQQQQQQQHHSYGCQMRERHAGLSPNGDSDLEAAAGVVAAAGNLTETGDDQATVARGVQVQVMTPRSSSGATLAVNSTSIIQNSNSNNNINNITPTSSNNHPHYPHSSTRYYKLIESRKKAAKMLIVIVIMFGLCYLPVHFLNILRYTTGLPQNDITTIASLVSHWLCYFNSAVNPLIYNFMSGKFRHEFANLFFCRFLRRGGGAAN